MSEQQLQTRPSTLGIPADPAASPDRSGRIVVSGLTKRYGDLAAVSDLSFTVEAGRVTGFLGSNGAGKTTTLRMLLGLVAPTAGSATIGGRHYVDLPEPARVVGAVLEASAAHRGRTGRNHLRANCLQAGLPLSRADEVLDLVGLTPAGDRKFRGYSLGMRQRLGIAAAMLGDPRVLILDEPANGLDPEGIRWMREFLRRLAAQGRTVLVSSHLLSEMQALADDVVIVAAGQLVRQGPVREVVSSLAGGDRVDVVSTDAEALAGLLRTSGATVIATGPGALAVTGLPAAAIGAAAHTADVVLHQLRTEQPDLEEVFLQLTSGKAAIR